MTRKCKQCKVVTIPEGDETCSTVCEQVYFAPRFFKPHPIIPSLAPNLDALDASSSPPIPATTRLTLPTDSAERKNYPLLSGCLKYFPAALAGVAHISKLGNDKHNPGQEMQHARGKSMDHGDCIVRHLTDLQDLLAAAERGTVNDGSLILIEVSSLAWRALALSQELHERYGAPLAPGARK